MLGPALACRQPRTQPPARLHASKAAHERGSALPAQAAAQQRAQPLGARARRLHAAGSSTGGGEAAAGKGRRRRRQPDTRPLQLAGTGTRPQAGKQPSHAPAARLQQVRQQLRQHRGVGGSVVLRLPRR